MTMSAIDRQGLIFKEIQQIDANRRAVRVWLFCVLLAIFFLVLVGGATRLTDSGLSITEWKPIHGVIPPLNAQEWEEEFRLYQQIPEYSQINKGMTLEAFQSIFWWEWAHRLIARSGSALATIQADDLGGEIVATNLPGTDRERPNWRHRAKLNGTGPFRSSRGAAILAAAAAERPKPA